MRELFRPAMLICLVLLVPILPFIAFGPKIETWSEQWYENPPAPWITATLVIGLLATDIFLPVPSSVISTMAGMQLGSIGGTAASWFGMTLGAIIGFALARRWGHRFAQWVAKPRDLDRMKTISDRYGPTALILVRGVPVLAEASVLLMGINGLSWRRFLPAVLLSNLGLALAYAVFGEVAQRNHWLPLALAVSIALPVLLATIVGRWLTK